MNQTLNEIAGKIGRQEALTWSVPKYQGFQTGYPSLSIIRHFVSNPLDACYRMIGIQIPDCLMCLKKGKTTFWLWFMNLLNDLQVICGNLFKFKTKCNLPKFILCNPHNLSSNRMVIKSLNVSRLRSMLGTPFLCIILHSIQIKRKKEKES